MHVSLFKTRRFIQTRLVFILFKHRGQIHNQLAQLWVGERNLEFLPATTLLFLWLAAMPIIPIIITISNVKQFFSCSRMDIPFVPRRIEERDLFLKNRNQRELFFSSSKLVHTEKKNFSPNFVFRKQKFFSPLKEDKNNVFCLLSPVLSLREISHWKIGQCPNTIMQRIIISEEILNHRSFKRLELGKKSTFSKYKQKWQEFLITKSKIICLKTVLTILEKQEVLFSNSFYWAAKFERRWKRIEIKNQPLLKVLESRIVRKFRFNIYPKVVEKNIKIQIPCSLFVFSSRPRNIKVFQVDSWDRRLSFSSISHIPGIKRKSFQKKVGNGRKSQVFLNRTSSERLQIDPSSTGIPRRWIPFFDILKNKTEQNFLLLESVRLFESDSLMNQQLGRYLANGDYIREKAEAARSEARWRTRNSRRWKNFSSIHIYRRPYRKAQPADLTIGRRFHPWNASYHRIIRQRSLFLKYLKKQWDERKQSLVDLRPNPFGELNLSAKKIRTHHFQRSVRLSSFIAPNFTDSKTESVGKIIWRRWNIPNLPILVKARWNWVKNWNQRSPFLLGETRRAGSAYRNRLGRHNLSWWKIIRPIFLDSSGLNFRTIDLDKSLTFFYRKSEINQTNINLSIKSFFDPIFSFLRFSTSIDQRTFSLRRKQKIYKDKIEKILFTDYTIFPEPKRKTLVIVPFRIFFLIRVGIILKGRFRSVQKDFVEALYQIIRRGRRIEIDPEWMQWLLDTLGISQQNAGIRIYLVHNEKKITLVQQITGLKKEIPFFLNLLIYLRRQKRKTFFQKFQSRTIEKKSIRLKKSYPIPLLLIGSPGTGKTRLVRALAAEAKVPVVYQCLASFSDMSTFTSFGFGRTLAPQAVQRGFREARSRIPTIFFLDELDFLGMSRSHSFKKENNKSFSEPQKKDKFINEGDQDLGLGQILVELDRKMKNYGLVLFRATNRPQKLDPALARPGRFHQVLSIQIPDKKKRRSLLKLYLQIFPYSKASFHFFINFQEYNQKKNKWRMWIIRIRGKSPAYFSSLRNLAALYQRTNKNVFSFENRIEVAWRRIEPSMQPNFRISSLKIRRKQKISKIILNYYLEYQYIERRLFSWKKKQTIVMWGKRFLFPGKKLFFSLKDEKQLISTFSITALLVQISLDPLILINRKLRLSFVKKKRIFKSRKFFIRTQTLEKKFQFNSLFQKSIFSRDWPNQWCTFTILEPIKLQTFTWVPFEKYAFQNTLKVYFENNMSKYELSKINQINIDLINLFLIQMHRSRRSLDFIVSRKYFF